MNAFESSAMFVPFAEAIGYVASSLVLAAFSVRSIVPLRSLALLSNVAFIAYALLEGLVPVLVLHAVLLPVNACRLGQELRKRTPAGERTGSGNASNPSDL